MDKRPWLLWIVSMWAILASVVALGMIQQYGVLYTRHLRCGWCLRAQIDESILWKTTVQHIVSRRFMGPQSLKPEPCKHCWHLYHTHKTTNTLDICCWCLRIASKPYLEVRVDSCTVLR